MIISGNLRHKLTFQVIGEVENEYGEMVEGVTSEFPRFAEIIESESRANIAADGREVEDYKTLRIRYSADINAALNIAYGGISYEISRIENPKNQNRELIIDAVSYLQN